MQIKCTTLFSFAKINHNWAGTHNHRGNLMTHFVFGSRSPNRSAVLLCALLCVHPAFTGFSKGKTEKTKHLTIKGSLRWQHSISFYFPVHFFNKTPLTFFFSFFPSFWDADSNFRLSGPIWNSVSFSNGTEVIELSYTLISSHSQILITVSEFKR